MRKFWPGDKHRQSIRITAMHVTKQNCRSLSNVFLIPCASLLMVSHTMNIFFKVLFIFPSRYLFAINLVPIFSFRRSLLLILDCIPKQPNSQKALRGCCIMCRIRDCHYLKCVILSNLTRVHPVWKNSSSYSSPLQAMVILTFFRMRGQKRLLPVFSVEILQTYELASNTFWF